MTALSALTLTAGTMVAIAAWSVAATHRSHRAFAAYATWMPLMDVVRLPLGALRRGNDHPLSGFARIAFHVEQAIVVSWSLFFLALCLHYYARRVSWLPVAIWAAISLGLVIAYPTGARSFGPLYYKTIAYFVTAASWAVIVHGAIFNRTIRVELAHILIAMYAAVDVVVISVPMARVDMTNWWLLQASNLVLSTVMIVAHAFVLLRRRSAIPAREEA